MLAQPTNLGPKLVLVFSFREAITDRSFQVPGGLFAQGRTDWRVNGTVH